MACQKRHICVREVDSVFLCIFPPAQKKSAAGRTAYAELVQQTAGTQACPQLLGSPSLLLTSLGAAGRAHNGQNREQISAWQVNERNPAAPIEQTSPPLLPTPQLHNSLKLKNNTQSAFPGVACTLSHSLHWLQDFKISNVRTDTCCTLEANPCGSKACLCSTQEHSGTPCLPADLPRTGLSAFSWMQLHPQDTLFLPGTPLMLL